MKRLPPIPTPPALRWREFRIRALPVVVFAAALAGVIWIWNTQLAAPTLVGEVEVRRAHVASIRPGTLAKLNVDRFSPVRAGDLVAEVLVSDPRYLESTLAVIKAEAEILRLQLDPLVTTERARVDFQRLRLELLDQQVRLASAQMHLRYAEAEYDRIAALRRESSGIASQTDLEIALRDRDSLRAEVQSRERLIRELESDLARLRVNQPPVDPQTLPEGWRLALELQEQRLKQALAEFGPVTLTAPIDGTVSTVYRFSGDNVAAGEPIVTITATRSERIVAYLIPPWRDEPQVGAPVEVRSRSGPRAAGQARILEVGRYLEPVTATLAYQLGLRASGLAQATQLGVPFNANNLPVPGLPLAISLPPGLNLRPGESVELRLLPPGNGAAAAASMPN
jgi:multidrug resistance efflux pump